VAEAERREGHLARGDSGGVTKRRGTDERSWLMRGYLRLDKKADEGGTGDEGNHPGKTA